MVRVFAPPCTFSFMTFISGYNGPSSRLLDQMVKKNCQKCGLLFLITSVDSRCLLQKTEAKVWTVETVIRSCAQQCGGAGTHLVRTGYELPTTIGAFVHCCNDRDLCNAAVIKAQSRRQTAIHVALSICLALYGARI